MRKRYAGTLCVVALTGMILTGCGNPSEQGVEYLEDGKYEEAIGQFEEAIEEEVNIGDAYRGIGIAKWEQEDYEGAFQAFEQALDNSAVKTGTIYNFMGNCQMQLEQPKRAINYYKMGLAQDDNSDELTKEMRFNLIAAYEQIQDIESARTELAQYVEDYPDDELAQKELEFLETR